MSESTGNGRLTAFLTLRGGWGGLAAALLYAALLALLFPEGVFHGQVFVSPDSVAPQGFADYVAREGIAPGDALWNPFIFGGMPAYASLAHDRNLYPPGPLLRGLSAIHLLPPLGWLLAHYLWLGLGVFLFLRRRGVRPYLAWLAGAWFVLLPPQVAIGAHGHGSKVMTLAWLPWALLFVDRLLDRRRALMDAGLFGLSLAGLLLAGHIQVAYYALLTLGLFALGRLVLIGASPGLADPGERADRIAADDALADRIQSAGVPAFVDYWESIPLFASQARLPEAQRAAIRRGRLANSPVGLANSLRGMGTGVQPFVDAGRVTMPVLALAGELDRKFVAIGQEMTSQMACARFELMVGAGHAAHLERPGACAEAIERFFATPTPTPTGGPE